jgi:hypothetical protein
MHKERQPVSQQASQSVSKPASLKFGDFKKRLLDNISFEFLIFARVGM